MCTSVPANALVLHDLAGIPATLPATLIAATSESDRLSMASKNTKSTSPRIPATNGSPVKEVHIIRSSPSKRTAPTGAGDEGGTAEAASADAPSGSMISIQAGTVVTSSWRVVHFWKLASKMIFEYRMMNTKREEERDWDMLHDRYAPQVLELVLRLRGLYVKLGQQAGHPPPAFRHAQSTSQAFLVTLFLFSLIALLRPASSSLPLLSPLLTSTPHSHSTFLLLTSTPHTQIHSHSSRLSVWQASTMTVVPPQYRAKLQVLQKGVPPKPLSEVERACSLTYPANLPTSPPQLPTTPPLRLLAALPCSGSRDRRAQPR